MTRKERILYFIYRFGWLSFSEICILVSKGEGQSTSDKPKEISKSLRQSIYRLMKNKLIFSEKMLSTRRKTTEKNYYLTEEGYLSLRQIYPSFQSPRQKNPLSLIKQHDNILKKFIINLYQSNISKFTTPYECFIKGKSESISIVPDCTFSTKNNFYHVEYERTLKSRKKLYQKILNYSKAKDQNLFTRVIWIYESEAIKKAILEIIPKFKNMIDYSFVYSRQNILLKGAENKMMQKIEKDNL